MIRVLVACEFSGRVRDAFRAKGHDAWSCDLLPTERPGPHIQDDVLKHLNDGWDLAIEHPPCDHLAVSGAKWFAEKRADGRQRAAIVFFLDLWETIIPKVALENPIGIMSGKREYLKKWYPDLYERAKILPEPQIIQPWMFGHPEQKATCLWLKNLPKLEPTNNVKEQMMKLPDNKRQRLHYLPPSPDRWKNRSRTFPGIAQAMADQWGSRKEKQGA